MRDEYISLGAINKEVTVKVTRIEAFSEQETVKRKEQMAGEIG